MKNPNDLNKFWKIRDEFVNAGNYEQAFKPRERIRKMVSDLTGFQKCFDSKWHDSREEIVVKAAHAHCRNHPDYNLQMWADYVFRHVSWIGKWDRDRKLQEVTSFRNVLGLSHCLDMTLCEMLEQPTDRLVVSHCLGKTVPTMAVDWFPQFNWPSQKNGTLPIRQSILLDEMIRSARFDQIRSRDWADDQIAKETVNCDSELGDHLQTLKLKVNATIKQIPVLADFLDLLDDKNLAVNISECLPFAWVWWLASEAVPSEKMVDAQLPTLGIFEGHLRGPNPDLYYWM
ncbi:MAG: hypothetical protein AAGA30_02840 [Planctomycetota bacterium]